jgi:hypothetical protein
MLPLDLHVLGMPPAFNLSQDQTLQSDSVTLLLIYFLLIKIARSALNNVHTPLLASYILLSNFLLFKHLLSQLLCRSEKGNYTQLNSVVNTFFKFFQNSF